MISSSNGSRPRLTWVTMLHDLAARERSGRRSTDDIVAAGERLTLRTREPLVVFADPELAPRLSLARSRLGLADRTLVVPLAFEETETARSDGALMGSIDPAYFETGPSAKDTPLFHLLTWAKLEHLARTAADNPFETPYIGWIDLGLRRQGPGETFALGEIAGAAPDRLRLLRMFPVAPADVGVDYRLHVFAGSVLTAPTQAWQRIERSFRSHARASLAAGVPRLEECVLASVWADDPDAVSVYDGDYPHVLSNFVRPTGGVPHLTWMVETALALARPALAVEIASPVLQAWRRGSLALTPAEAHTLIRLACTASAQAAS